jgi:Amt family ammonium transporter
MKDHDRTTGLEAIKHYLNSNFDEDFEPQSVPFVVVGTMALWFSWLFFNGGSTGTMFTERANGPAKIMMNTVVSGATSGIFSVILKPRIMKTHSHISKYDIGALCNGILCGLVSVTGVCDRTEPWIACFIGAIASLVYCFAAKLLECLKIDDPIEATPVHGFGGVWGLIAVGIFDNAEGLISSSAGKGRFFGIQIAGMLAIIAWTSVVSGSYFLFLRCCNKLRVRDVEELIGLDYMEMGGMTKAFFDNLIARKKADDYAHSRLIAPVA